MRELEELRAKAEELEKLKAKLKKRDQQIASLQEAIFVEKNLKKTMQITNCEVFCWNVQNEFNRLVSGNG